MEMNGYFRKARGTETRKRNRLIFISAEGNNKTETNYLKQFSNKEIRFRFVSGTTTDPINMSKDLIKKMINDGFDKELGDLAYCLIDGDNKEYKNIQIKEADRLAEKYNFEVILSNPCFEIWLLCHYCFTTKQYKDSNEVISDLKKYIPNYSKDMKEIVLKNIDKAILNACKLEKWNNELNRKQHTVSFLPNSEVYKMIAAISGYSTSY